MANDFLRVRFYRDPLLRAICHRVTEFDGRIVDLMMKMAATMHRYDGVGLAAPQVGIPERIIVADIGDGLLAVANPKIEERVGLEFMIEGCLSLPGIQVEVERSRDVFLRAQTADGKERTWECNGLIARVVQHEIDHLDGILIIDHASFAQRFVFKRRIKKLERMHQHAGDVPPEHHAGSSTQRMF